MILPVAIAATFVAEPLEGPLSWVLGQAGIQGRISFAPYNQIFQELLAPRSELARTSAGICILLLRLEDYIRDEPNPEAALQTIGRVASELTDSIETFARQVKGALLVAVLLPGPGLAEPLVTALIEASRLVEARIAQLPGVHVLKECRVNLLADASRYDGTRDRLAHIPYTENYFAALALAIARRIHAIRIPAAKVLALDCDNTLWQGVVGEDGIDGVDISAPFVALQEYAVAQQAKGTLICLVSKNTEADVLQVLAKRRDMRLQSHHIVAHRINWMPKPANLRSLAEELNLGLDSFVFLDDNPVECAQMQAELPEVVTIQVPTAPEIPGLMAHLWNFDKLATTAEDAQRTRMYRENAARRAMESASTDINQFISALNITVDIAGPNEDDWPRLQQLTQRTNQFNFTTHRWTAAELKSALAEGAHILRVRVSDRFGDYGLVGAIIAWPNESELRIDTLLLSCRVLGRGVEHAMVRRLGEIAFKQGLDVVALPFVATERNIPARAFAESIAAEFATKTEGGAVYRIPSAIAIRVEHRPGHDPAEIIDARLADEKKLAGKDLQLNGNLGRSERYSKLATVLVSGRAVLEQMSLQVRRARQIDKVRIAPASPLETELLRLWEEVLAIDGLGVDDDYFELGGTSLLSVKLFAEIERRIGAQLRLTAILEAPTVRSLAQLIGVSGVRDRGGMVCLKSGGHRKLFLVHDGFGETLLYLNLARRLPSSISVYGIEPRRIAGIPLAHASIEEMAEFYVEQMREIQPHGPYMLGGMCAGGVIAYEMAACLTRQNERVELVTILDGATPHAAKRVGRVLQNRLTRMESTLSEAAASSRPRLARLASLAVTIAGKIKNVAAYECSSAIQRQSVRLRFLLLKMIVRRSGKWPSVLRALNVMQIYNSLESSYHPPKLAEVPVLLIRASSGDGIDTPYRDVYRDEDFGWSQYAARLEVVDVSGGHSSMLQEIQVQMVTDVLLKRLKAVPADMPEPMQLS